MQLFSRNKALAALSLGALAALGACGDDVTVPAPVNPPVAVTISPSNASVNTGATIDLAVAITGGTTTPTLASCSSSSAAVATAAVQGGNACRVTGVTPGAVTITATTSGGQTAAASVTVNAPSPAIAGIAVTPAAANLQVGATTTITANPTTAAPNATVSRAFQSSNSAVATVTAAGVVTAVAPGQATITVTLTGSGTGLSTATVTGQVSITVTALPPSVTGVTVTPQSALLVVGGTQQLTASAQLASGVTNSTITYGTTNPGVATVSATGLVTAIGAGQATITVTASSTGNASFGAATATATVPVTVNNPANVTIGNVTQGPTVSATRNSLPASSNDGIVFSANSQVNQPVDQLNVRDQIQVTINLQPNGNQVASARVYICDAAGANCGAPAAEQTFANNAANASSLQLILNTADFTANFANGTATTKYANGQHTIKASVRLPDGTETFSAVNNAYILNFNNLDGWAAQFNAPSRVAQGTNTGSTNLNWHGGPGAAGAGNYTVVPVIYTPSRSIRAFESNLFDVGGIVGSCDADTDSGNAEFPVNSVAPFSVTYGKAESESATVIGCDGYAHPAIDRSNFPGVINAIDNVNNSAPTVAFAAGYRTSVAVQPITTIRLDYQNPSVSVSGPSTQWANAAFDFAASANLSWSDQYVGKGSTAPSFTYTGCVSGNGGEAVAMATSTGASIPECSNDFTPNVYTVEVTVADALGNQGTDETGSFAVDKTAPGARYSTDTDTTGTSYATAPGNATVIYQPEAIDERSGLQSWSHFLAGANQANPTGACYVGSVPTDETIGASFLSAPNCAYTSSSSFGSTLGDGYRIATTIVGNSLVAPGGLALNAYESYYSYRAKVTDRAGNETVLPVRTILVNYGTPLLGGIGLPATITAGGSNTFTPSFAEAVEAIFTNLRFQFGGSTTAFIGGTSSIFQFPAARQANTFDNAILLNGNVNLNTPFTSGTRFYTNVEFVDASSNIVDAASSFRPEVVGARIYNGAGNVSSLFTTNLLLPNVENDTVSYVTKLGINPMVTPTSWQMGNATAAYSAPSDGLKALFEGQSCSISNLNCQVNPPFQRVDFYRLVSGEWRYLASVSANAPNGSTLFMADNGVRRVWTYRLPTSTAITNPDGSTSTIGTPNGNSYIAVGSIGAARSSSPLFGRVLSTRADAGAYNLPFALVSVSIAASSATVDGSTTSTITATPVWTGVTGNVTYSCTVSSALATYVTITPTATGCTLSATGVPAAAVAGTVRVTATGSLTGTYTSNSVQSATVAITRNP